MTVVAELLHTTTLATDTMRATVFHAPGDIRVEAVPRPHAGPGEAVIRVTLTTICGTDIHIVKGEYPVRPGPRSSATSRSASSTSSGPASPATRSASASSSARSPRAASAAPACRATSASAATATASRPSAAGGSATPSTAPRPSTCSSRRRRRTSPRSRTASRTSRSSSSPTSPRPGSAAPSRARADRRRGRRVRPGPDRPVRRRRRQAHGRVAHHRRRQRPGPARDGQADGRRRRPRLHAGRRGRRSEAPDRRRRRRHDRGAGHPGYVRERASLPAAGRDALEPRRLLRQARDAVRRLRRRPWRPQHRHDAMPGRQGAHAAAHCHGESGRFDPLPLITHRFALDDIVEAYDLFATAATAS